MAPYNTHEVTDVESITVLHKNEDPKTPGTGPLDSMRWFLHVASEKDIDSKEPPAKRRKIDNDNHQDSTGPEEISLYSISVDLHFPAYPKIEEGTGEQKISTSIDIDETNGTEVNFIGINNEGTVLSFSSPGRRETTLTATIGRLQQASIRALDHIAAICTEESHPSSRKAKSDSAVILRCVLNRSNGPQSTVVRFTASLKWRSGISAFPEGMPMGRAKWYQEYDILLRLYPDVARKQVDHSKPWNAHDFYDSVHVPSKDEITGKKYDEILTSELFPFQKRAISWLLRREGVKYEHGQIHQLTAQDQEDEFRFFAKIKDAGGQKCYINYLQGIIVREQPILDRTPLRGGLLAEEMGLGKTVELLALVSLHSRPANQHDKMLDELSNTEVTPSKTTLIITPPSILQQWKSEISIHAPHLKVFVYEGIPSGGKKARPESEVIQDLATKYDIVLATYNTIGKEVHFAEDPPDRNMRHARKFERKRSPLVRIQWWRICLDEAQLVESGVTAAARVACRLPRLNSWAVSGTPLRKNVQDLHGLLIFLRYQPLSGNQKLWNHMITNHKHLFRRIFGSIALRHTKEQIRDELQLPPQKRVVITVPFSAVEQQHYATMFSEMCQEAGLDLDGSPKDPRKDWIPEEHAETMRSWLMRLRQTCLHPEVGGRNRRALGRGHGPLRTVAEVLEVMIEQNETNMRTEERAFLASQLLRGHILGYNREDDHRSEKALEIYKAAMVTSSELVQDARERLKAAKEKILPDQNTETDSEGEDPNESNPILGRLRNNLRTALELKHVCTFFVATMYFQIKTNETLTKPESVEFKQLENQEIDLYDEAKAIRREILSQTSRKAEALMRKINELKDKSSLTNIPEIKELADRGGIENRRVIEKSDDLFEIIGEQTKVIVEWRSTMAEFLLKPLVDEDHGKDEITGDEYEDSTKQQDELYVYFDAVKAMQADLNTLVTGESAPLIDHEVKNLIRDAKWFLDPEIDFDAPIHAPELSLKLLSTRNKFRARLGDVGSVRGLIHECRSLENSLEMQSNPRAATERQLIQKHLQDLQNVFRQYTKVLSGLEKDLDLFRSTQNQRIEFYRQLQMLSDAVAPYKEELDDTLDLEALEAIMAKEEHQSDSLAQLKTKNRFLLHLRDESGNNTEQRICVICRDSFESGVLTVCGHQYCKECIQYWWQQHRSCPVCKRKLALVDFHNITYKPQELKAHHEDSPVQQRTSSSENSSPQQSSIYSNMDSKLLNQIKSIDLPSSYGTKIDTLGRHLHWLREQDPGAKSIVFSQYREFLDVLGTALTEFKVGYSRFGRQGAVERFRQDPSVDCLLLDAKTDSSGLTLVNATHVFICEPLIQTAVELQAIARVHRIGQTRPTTVWMYLISDTVEEAIYEISVARRLAHIRARQRDSGKAKSGSVTPAPGVQENALDAANSEEMQFALLSKLLVAGKGGGEMVGNDDLWQCLFGKGHKTSNRGNAELEGEVGRYLRAEAAEGRKQLAVDKNGFRNIL